MEVIQIKKQIWTKSNLDVDHYRNGDSIPEIKDRNEWSRLKTGAWCYYNNDPQNNSKLYNGYAVNDERGLAPEGYHIPTINDFKTLISNVNNNGNSLKAKVTDENDIIRTASTNFSAILSGYRSNNGLFNSLEYDANFWSSTPYNSISTYFMYLIYSGSDISLYDNSNNYGFTVRLLKD